MAKLDINKLREKLAAEGQKKGRSNDPTFLNYYDMKPGEKMVIRLLPASDNDEIYLSYAQHGPNMKVPGVSSVRCLYEARGESCPACAKSYEIFQSGDKDGARKWRAKESFLGQCLVIKSPIEVPDSPDGNPVKKIHLPYKVKELIKNAIINGAIDDPCERNFVLVKGENAGGMATYEHSFFEGKDSDLPPEYEEAFEEGIAYLYDLEKDLPDVVSEAEIEEWIEKTEEKLSGSGSSRSATGRATATVSADDDESDTASDDDEPAATATRTTAASLRERLAARKRA